MQYKSFSILELIFVITISSLVIMLSFSSISDFAKGIKTGYSNNIDNIELSNTITIIKKRVSNSIPFSIGFLNNSITWLDSSQELALEFAFVADLSNNQTNKEQIVLYEDLNNLYQKQLNLNFSNLKTYSNQVLIFDNNDSNIEYFKVRCKNQDCTKNILEFEDKSTKTISQRFYLTSFAYSLLLEDTNLYLVRFKPWNNQNESNGERFLLLDGVSKFEVSSNTNSIKVCKNEICKEAVL